MDPFEGMMKNPGTSKMSLDVAFELMGWGKDDWPSESEVKRRHKDLLLKYHPDKAPLALIEQHTQMSARLNHAKEVIMRAHGMHSAEDLDDEGTRHSTSENRPTPSVAIPKGSLGSGLSMAGRSTSAPVRNTKLTNSPTVQAAPMTNFFTSGSMPNQTNTADKKEKYVDTSGRKADSKPPSTKETGNSAKKESFSSAQPIHRTRSEGAKSTVKGDNKSSDVQGTGGWRKSSEGAARRKELNGWCDILAGDNITDSAEACAPSKPTAKPEKTNVSITPPVDGAAEKERTRSAHSGRTEVRPLPPATDTKRSLQPLPTGNASEGNSPNLTASQTRILTPFPRAPDSNKKSPVVSAETHPVRAPALKKSLPQSQGHKKQAHSSKEAVDRVSNRSTSGTQGTEIPSPVKPQAPPQAHATPGPSFALDDLEKTASDAVPSNPDNLRPNVPAPHTRTEGAHWVEDGEDAEGGFDDEGDTVLVTMKSVVPPWNVILGNLKLLGQLKDHDKLIISGDTVSIDSSGLIGGVSRWLSSQGRYQTASWLSRFSMDLAQVLKLLIAGLALSGDDRPAGGQQGYQPSRKEMLHTLALQIDPCIQGISRLKATYADDDGVGKRLDKVIAQLCLSKDDVSAWMSKGDCRRS